MVDASTKCLDSCGIPFAKDEDCVVRELSTDATYEASAKCNTASGWGEFSPVSAPLKLSSLRLPAPGAPVLQGVSASSLRVLVAPISGSTRVDVWVRPVGNANWMAVERDGSLVKPPCKAACLPTDEVIVKGLDSGVQYEACCAVNNAFGWSEMGPGSAPLMLEIPTARFSSVASRRRIVTRSYSSKPLMSTMICRSTHRWEASSASQRWRSAN